MGRKPLGEKKLTNAEKSKRCRDRKNAEERKLKDKLHKQVARQKIYADSDRNMQLTKKEEMNHRVSIGSISMRKMLQKVVKNSHC